ncbi:2-oxopent-4-enoate hydratase, partial [Variovorax sp. VRV01]|nr:2-oxopent-4-enoate hydratase [Variovorax sp. VRV01]
MSAAAGGLAPASAAHALCLARREGRRVPSALLQTASRSEAYAI